MATMSQIYKQWQSSNKQSENRESTVPSVNHLVREKNELTAALIWLSPPLQETMR